VIHVINVIKLRAHELNHVNHMNHAQAEINFKTFFSDECGMLIKVKGEFF